MPRIPKLLAHARGYFFVRITGPDGKRRDHILGRDRANTEFQYNQFVAERCKGRINPQVQSQPIRSRVNLSIDELVGQYLETIRDQYEPTDSFRDYKKVGELLSRLYGNLPTTAFLIPHFQRLIRTMISSGFALRTINVRIGFVKHFFKYALDCEAITAEQFFKIKSVPRLRRGDNRVKPERIVPPVEVDVVNRTIPYFSPMIADMVTVQLHSGMRAGELCRMNWSEIDRSGGIWMYRPAKHKTASKGKTRAIPLGTVCRGVLSHYTESAGDYVFNPQDIERRASAVCKPRATNLKTCYDTERYTREIRRGVNAAISAGAIATDERWTSHQLRHRAGTDARAMFGIDAAQLLLGHSDVRTTERYAIPDESKMMEYAEKLG